VAFGQWLRQGPEDQRDTARGWQLLQSAALAGNGAAHWHMALVFATGAADVPKNIQAALEHCGVAAEGGFVPAMATMGVLCASLNRHEDAVYWWRQAAQAGDLEAQFNLAQALKSGRGTAPDQGQAFRWMLDAAEAGLPQAQAELGVRYATGEGVAKDPIEAHKWFFMARLAGNAGATKNTELSQQRLPAEQIEEGERRARSWRASQRRHG
jgi:TPR repeat protein